MEYFSKNIHFNLLKNYILKDPVCDWFTIQEFLKNPLYKRDKENEFNKYINEKSLTFKDNLINIFKDNIHKKSYKLVNNNNETLDFIDKNYDLIINPCLKNKDNIFITCDLLVKYSLFKKVYPKINLELKNNDYMIISIIYTTVEFKKDKNYIIDNNYLVYEKCKINELKKTLYEKTEKKYEAFILAKDYIYKDEKLINNENICKVESEKYNEIYQNSLSWIKNLKKNYKKMNILPKPTNYELYPNMNFRGSLWENEKFKLASKIKELTLVWNISIKERNLLLEKNIKSWDNPNLIPFLKNEKQEKLIHINNQNEIIISPRKNISYDFKIELKKNNNEIFLDIESFLSIENSLNNENPKIAIIGFFYNNKYYDYTINNYTIDDEKYLLKNFSEKLNSIDDKNIIIYHWGNAEINYFKYIYEKYPKIKFPEIKFIDVLKIFKIEPITINKVFKFGLKEIGKELYNKNLIKTTWDENDNGLESMIKFKNICCKKKNIPIKRYLEIENILNYNLIDCKVLMEIVELLRKKYL